MPKLSVPWENAFAALGNTFSTPVMPEPLPNPRWVAWDAGCAQRLGLQGDAEDFLPLCAGQQIWPGSEPRAMVYSGHQFGHWAGQLGDGRGILLGDLATTPPLDIHLKGAGRTPYSRFGDGRAVLRSCIREYLASRALAGLGIPSSQALGVVVGDEPVQRECTESRAILVRVAKTHLRFGSFEHFFYRNNTQALHQLADFCLARYWPDAPKGVEGYRYLFEACVTATAQMIAAWQAVGFAHGVMNTDNMSLLGETFDYGPYGFMETYDPSFICNHSDDTGRYAFDQQPGVGLWNLQALAHALSPLIPVSQLQETLGRYQPTLVDTYAQWMRKKMGLTQAHENDQPLCSQWLQLLQAAGLDYHLSFHALAGLPQGQDSLLTLVPEAQKASCEAFIRAYGDRLAAEPGAAQAQLQCLREHNPVYVLRNYLAQEAIEAAQAGDFTVVAELAERVSAPFTAVPGQEKYAEPAPAWASELHVSCSS
jgi:serine/tyrosine/threonine adenylyltransferase